MFPLVRQAIAPRLAHPVACTIRYSSSQSESDGWQDPGLEQRRAERLAREAARNQSIRDPGPQQRRAERLIRETTRNRSIHSPAIEQRSAESLAREAASDVYTDPGIEQRRAARLARETASQPPTSQNPTTEKLPNQMQVNDSGIASTSSRANSRSQGKSRPRKFSRRDHLQSSLPRGIYNPSETEDTQLGIAETIMAITYRAAENRTKAQGPTVSTDELSEESLNHLIDSSEPLIATKPKFTGPEPVVQNMASLLNTAPNLASCFPPLPSHRKLQQVDLAWIKEVYGGDYSEYQLETSSYTNGIRGPNATYAKIILQHNPSVPLESQRELIEVIQKIGD